MRSRSQNRFTAEIEAIYGSIAAQSITLVETFQVCEYGKRPSKEELRELFPFLPEFKE